MLSTLRIEPSGESSLTESDGLWRTLWGYVYADETARAVFYMRFNATELLEATFVVSVGEWGDGSSKDERNCVACLARVHEGSLAFMLVDAETTSFADQEFLGQMMPAAQVRGTPLAQEVFRILDELMVQDERIAELRPQFERKAQLN